MVDIRSYLTTHFAKGFFTIFLPFFLIISLVYLVKISALTAQIKITFFELLKLFSYSVPDIVFYTIPLSFVAALTNVLLRLSSDNELIALYALGFPSKKLLRTLFIIAALFSIFLLVISFFAMPTSKQLYKSFKQEKRSEAQFNIIPGKLGQKFGEYYIYVKSQDDNGTYHDLVIYNRTDMSNEQFFASKYGRSQKTDGVSSLLLNDGYGYTYAKEKLQEARYMSLEVFDTKRAKPFRFEDIVAYWSRAKTETSIMHRMLFFIFISLMPILSVLIISAFSLINPRYQNAHSFLITFSVAFLFYMTASFLERWGNFFWLGVAIVAAVGIGYYFFKKRVIRFF